MTSERQSRAPAIYLIAAEESGDALGASLARALNERVPGTRLAGIGGRAMAAAGIVSPFAIEQLSILGLSAIPRRLPVILKRIHNAAAAVVAARPDALVIIDSPDFTHRVARRVRRAAPAIPIIDYVSPSIWAWRPGRARAMCRYIDCVLAILPFEPAAHLRLGGPPCLYVGHPLVDRIAELRPSADEIKRRLSDPPIVLVLPGSRSSEIRRLLAIFGTAVARAAARIGPVEFLLPTVPHLLDQVNAAVAAWPVRPRIVVEPVEKWAAFRSARAALAASGTVTLELALSGIPTVGAYRVSLLEEMVARLMRSPEISTIILANLVIGENIVPEFMQRDCVPETLAEALVPLVLDTAERRRQIEAFKRLDTLMAIGTASPSSHAAAVVLDLAKRGRRDVAMLKTAPRPC